MIPQDLAQSAQHGTFCPKMCNFACPVLRSTGREGAAPWGLHTLVAGIADRTVEADADAYHGLRGCTGCHACRHACLYDLDVPAEVRAARGAILEAGEPTAEAATVLDRLHERVSPYVADPLAIPDAPESFEVSVFFGCADTQETVDAVESLLRAAGVPHRLVTGDPCCGGVADDLGDAVEARAAQQRVGDSLDDSSRLFATDPHCLPHLRSASGLEAEAFIVLLDELVADGRLRLGAADDAVTYHDPCLLARDEGVIEPPRRLLRAISSGPVEPEGSGAGTICAGAGMAFDLIAPIEARAVAMRRSELLRATGHTAVTACARATGALRGAGCEAQDLIVFAARHIAEPDA